MDGKANFSHAVFKQSRHVVHGMQLYFSVPLNLWILTLMATPHVVNFAETWIMYRLYNAYWLDSVINRLTYLNYENIGVTVLYNM